MGKLYFKKPHTQEIPTKFLHGLSPSVATMNDIALYSKNCDICKLLYLELKHILRMLESPHLEIESKGK